MREKKLQELLEKKSETQEAVNSYMSGLKKILEANTQYLLQLESADRNTNKEDIDYIKFKIEQTNIGISINSQMLQASLIETSLIDNEIMSNLVQQLNTNTEKQTSASHISAKRQRNLTWAIIIFAFVNVLIAIFKN